MTVIPASTNNYSENIVVFIDVLGFSDLIMESATDPVAYEKVNKLLKELKDIADHRTKEFERLKKAPRIKSKYRLFQIA